MKTYDRKRVLRQPVGEQLGKTERIDMHQSQQLKTKQSSLTRRCVVSDIHHLKKTVVI